MTKILGGFNVVNNMQHKPDGSVVSTQKGIGCIEQLPLGVIILRLYGDTDFAALPRDAAGHIAAVFEPLGRAGANFGKTLQAQPQSA